MLIFKKKINIVILVIISIITVIPLMINGKEFIPLSFGHLFMNFYFLFLWLIFQAFRVHSSRDMHIYKLSRYNTFFDYMKDLMISYARSLFWDVSLFILVTSLVYWLLDGYLELIHIILYFIVLYLITLIYWTMLTWSLVVLKSYFPVILITFGLFFNAWFSMNSSPYFNPLLGLSTVFTKQPIGYHEFSMPSPYNAENIFAFFVSIIWITIACFLIMKFKKRRLSL